MGPISAVTKLKESISRGRPSGARSIEFSISAPWAKEVCLAGTFNSWNATALPMKKGKEGTWKVKIMLPPGKHEYKYVVDGEWAPDAQCPESVMNGFGTYNSVIAV